MLSLAFIVKFVEKRTYTKFQDKETMLAVWYRSIREVLHFFSLAKFNSKFVHVSWIKTGTCCSVWSYSKFENILIFPFFELWTAAVHICFIILQMEDIEILLKTLQDEHLVFRSAYKDVMVGTCTPNHLSLFLFQIRKILVCWERK